MGVCLDGGPDADLTNYSWATHATEGNSEWWDATVEYIVDVMTRDGAIWIVADSMARPSDPFLRSPVTTAERVDAGEEIYWLARRPTALDVKSAWDSSDSAAGVMGVMSRADISPGEASPDELQDVAANASHVVISAYDNSDRPIVFKRRDE